MEHRPLIVGVRHAGNRALRAALGLNSHRHPDHYDLKSQLARHKNLIVPVRDPMSLAISWYRRPRGKNVKFILTEVEQLQRHIKQANAVSYIPMDLPLRAHRLENVAAKYGLTLTPPPPPPVRPIHLPREVLVALHETVAPIYDTDLFQFYENPGPVGLTWVEDELADERREVDAFGCMHSVWDRSTGKQKR